MCEHKVPAVSGHEGCGGIVEGRNPGLRGVRESGQGLLAAGQEGADGLWTLMRK